MPNIWLTEEVSAMVEEARRVIANNIAKSLGHTPNVTNVEVIRMLFESFMQRQKQLEREGIKT